MHPIAFHRKAKGWTQKELAVLLKVNLSALQAWEQKGSRPRPRRIADMAQLFGMTGEDLLTEIEKYGKGEGAA